MKHKPFKRPAERLRLIARSLLEKGGVLDEQWTLSDVLRHTDEGVELILTASAAVKSIAVQWHANHSGIAPKAFKVGPHTNASYRNGPTYWNIDAADTPPDIKERAFRACEVLTTHENDPGLWLATDEAEPLPKDHLEGSLPDDPIDALTTLLRYRLNRDLGTPSLPNPEGWQLQEVRSFLRWQRVSEVILEVDGKTLAFIISPRDDKRPAFCRTQNYDLVYYSDDLEASEHAALYARDGETIDRFSHWLRAWDRGAA
jgi:hypothetical protein